ncbi:PREDICTED: 11-beta-hydroxysteroid dehydrogenase 1B-like [Nelumbo nucifera]|uniref:11-beta-hydroxysteroid dehydrogenase 1B-like n=2 Tax=Nelumbo nucifera TaxID=4432 RepID=A0A822YTK7_NELNU|nr:PREDICTED: 11-beta-hydroxysteroid dehydrogenase 1B-like [Nelumbo nucifera]DAD35982.1 TPA_asm: hypothetical protein HUJ06_006622 [Nelumbo nucifera]
MEFLHKLIMNLVVPPVGLIILCLTLPLLLIYRFIRSILTFSSQNIAGKVVLITGASSGIGEHLAYEYARRGASLVLVARREKSLREVAERARQLGSPDVLVIRADVSKVAECKRFVDRTMDHFRRMDHLVCNAGVYNSHLFECGINAEISKPVMDINFWGSIYPTYFAIPHLKKSKGKIIVNASVAGWAISPWASVYGASKAALINFFETLRLELAQEVTITIVAPAFIQSEITQGKHLNKEGILEVDPKLRKIINSRFQVKSAGECAKAIVNGACRGERYVVEPSYYRLLFLFHFMCPEIVEWFVRLICRIKPIISKSNTNGINN